MSKAQELMERLRELSTKSEDDKSDKKLAKGYYHLSKNKQIVDGPFNTYQDAHNLLPPFLARVVYSDGKSVKHTDDRGDVKKAADDIVGKVDHIKMAIHGDR